MSERKQDRQRRKRTEAKRKQAREKAERIQREAREWRSYEAADRAEELLRGGAAESALKSAARAAELNPGDSGIVELYLRAAEQAHDVAEQARALAHLAKLVKPDAALLTRLAFLQVESGQWQAAARTAAVARLTLPRNKKERAPLLGIINYVEGKSAYLSSNAAAGENQAELPFATGNGRVSGSRKSSGRTERSPEEQTTAGPTRGVAKPRAPRPSPGRPAKRAPAEIVRPATAPERASPESIRDNIDAPARFQIQVEIAADVDGLEVLYGDDFADPEEIELALLAARLRDAESYQRLLALERAQGLLPFSHQEETARKVLSVFLGRALLADEVGLGKTIEAGLILSEYLLRGRVERALVLAPPTLVGQWREELASKFGISARTTEEAAFKTDAARFWTGAGVVIASLATARHTRQRDLVIAQSWDLVIIDEAHALKNANTESYFLASRINTRFLLLLTATPVENRIEELYNLVSLLRPGHLGGRAAFLKRFSDAKVRQSESTRAEVRTLLGEVMVRNTRALSGVPLPPRFARTVLVPPEPSEGELYDHLVKTLRALGPGGPTRLLLSVLLQEAGSSPYAVRATLEKLRAGGDLSDGAAAALGPAIQCAERPIETGKAGALLRVLDGAAAATVVFTRYRATLDFLVTSLQRAGIRHERIDGSVPAPLRHEAIGRLQQRGGVLLSTEVGAEGLNLQFCSRIVNFDLPWNPMRIEQRIGRVHRIGQDHAVEVINFCLAGSIEERILEILDERINLFELVVGEAEMILGYLADEREFGDLVFNAFADPDATARALSFARIGDALAAARARYENVKRFDEAFFRNELGV
ncbi:MAG: DEAD/DEAH box helicase [Longimicrobiales bacterium]